MNPFIIAKSAVIHTGWPSHASINIHAARRAHLARAVEGNASRTIMNNCVSNCAECRLEGTNNKIKTMKRQAYGYRDQEFFELKILALHEMNYQLVG